MEEKTMRFLSLEDALKIVAAIQEEEDIHNKDKRILTVYNYEDQEVCWFDYQEVKDALKAEGKSMEKSCVQDYVLRHIPDWGEEG